MTPERAARILARERRVSRRAFAAGGKRGADVAVIVDVDVDVVGDVDGDGDVAVIEQRKNGPPGAPYRRARSTQASTSSSFRGISLVSSLYPPSVISTSSSIRTPNPCSGQ